MGSVYLIAAVGLRGQVGLNGDMPWGRTMKDDLRWFRETTKNSILITGSATAKTLPCPIGHGRTVYVWHRDVNPKELLDFLRAVHPDKDIYVIGGVRTWQAFWPWTKLALISHVEYDGPADTWFPFNALVVR
ncbi:MAG: dihydrofolate reductase [Nitrospira sp.]